MKKLKFSALTLGGAVALDIFGSLFMHYMTYVLRVGTSLASQAMSLISGT